MSKIVNSKTERTRVYESVLDFYLKQGWEKGWDREEVWFQYKTQAPRFSTLSPKTQKTIAKEPENYTIYRDCPICHKPFTKQMYCCCEEHFKQAEEKRKVAKKQLHSEGLKRGWAKCDKDERIKNLKGTPHPRKDPQVWIHKENQDLFTTVSKLDFYLSQGWEKGRSPEFYKNLRNRTRQHWEKYRKGEKPRIPHKVGITNGKENKRVLPEEFESWIQQGWRKGRTNRVRML